MLFKVIITLPYKFSNYMTNNRHLLGSYLTFNN